MFSQRLSTPGPSGSQTSMTPGRSLNADRAENAGMTAMVKFEATMSRCMEMLPGLLDELIEIDEICGTNMVEEYKEDIKNRAHELVDGKFEMLELKRALHIFETQRKNQISLNDEGEEEEELLTEDQSAREFRNCLHEAKKNPRIHTQDANYKKIVDTIKRLNKANASRAGEEDDDDEFEAFDGNQRVIKCAITQLPMKDPVKNKVCGHTFSREGVDQLIQMAKSRKKTARCPAIGCNNRDKFDHEWMEDDKEMRAQIEETAKLNRLN